MVKLLTDQKSKGIRIMAILSDREILRRMKGNIDREGTYCKRKEAREIQQRVKQSAW
jgi:hypothetical protein